MASVKPSEIRLEGDKIFVVFDLPTNVDLNSVVLKMDTFSENEAQAQALRDPKKLSVLNNGKRIPHRDEAVGVV